MNLRFVAAACALWTLTHCTPESTAGGAPGSGPLAQAAIPASVAPGKRVYDRACAACHASPSDARTPTFSALAALPADTIRDAMREGGKMAPMAASLSEAEKEQLVAFLTYGQVGVDADWTAKIMCAADNRQVDVDGLLVSNGFSVDRDQTRSLSAAQAGLTKAALRSLETAWVLAFPGQGSGTGAAILGDTMFVTGGGFLLALDTARGCARWVVRGSSRNTPTIGELDGRKVVAVSVANDVLVVDAKTGAKVWQANGQSTDNPGIIRGGVAIHDQKVIVPISSSGVVAAQTNSFECCEGHGAVVALSGKDGAKLWEYHTMPKATYNGKVSSIGVRQRGPSGAPIWSFPLIDEKRNRVIVTTGENTSHPATDTSDAIIALDLATGREVWKFQAMASDVWNMSCTSSRFLSGPNCPWNIAGDLQLGRDFDFGAGALLTKTAAGAEVLLTGQKSGDVFALDPATGKKLWSAHFGVGGAMGGVHWGVTTDGGRVFAAINDPVIYPGTVIKPGVYAADIATGKQVWAYAARASCGAPRNSQGLNCTGKFGF
ncbi:MAG: PQQ-binding-like beta-propeller repeat protein, partial [Polyangiales bacterium]